MTSNSPKRRRARQHGRTRRRNITAHSTIARVQDLPEPDRRTVMDFLRNLLRLIEGRKARARDDGSGGR